jgi:hypothetical protein
MSAVQSRTKWPGPEYVIRQRFRAPIGFVFDWCTDFSPKDASLERDQYERKILEREPRRVVYEDLGKDPDGWFWSRQVVTLRRPTAWHMEGVGNRRNIVADYALKQVSRRAVELELRYRRRPSLLKFVKRPKLPLEKEGRKAWKYFARALERDFRASRRSKPRRRR